MAPAVGLEPTTKRLTAARSTTELRRSEVDRGCPTIVGARPGQRAGQNTSLRHTDRLWRSSPSTSWRGALDAGDADLRVVDVRWYLSNPAPVARAYDAGHIPGAIFLDLDDDLADPDGLGAPGRHPLPAPAAFARRLASVGIGSDHFVVAYDDAGGTDRRPAVVDARQPRPPRWRGRPRRRDRCLDRPPATPLTPSVPRYPPRQPRAGRSLDQRDRARRACRAPRRLRAARCPRAPSATAARSSRSTRRPATFRPR